MRTIATLTVALLAAGAVTLPASAAPPGRCDATDHRASAGPHIDDNTLNGIAWDTQHRLRSEVDLTPLTDGAALFHEHNWNKGTTGHGAPWTTTSAYTDTLTTTMNKQQVPLWHQVTRYLHTHPNARLLAELDNWQIAGTRPWLRQVIATARQWHVMPQIQWTGTRGALSALAGLAPRTVAVYRLDHDERLTALEARAMALDVIAVSVREKAADVRLWRNRGYGVVSRQSTSVWWPRLVRLGIYTTQTNSPLAWVGYCRRHR